MTTQKDYEFYILGALNYCNLAVSFPSSSQLTLPGGTGARFGHSITSYSVGSGLIHAIMFGGSSKFERGQPPEDQQKIAETIVVAFGE